MSRPLVLSVSDVVSVAVSLSPTPSQTRNFGSLLILGDSEVIDSQSRFRQYSGITGVGGDYPTTSPEYLAAVEFFAQTPQPSICYIGAWARNPTHGVLIGATLGSTQQAITNFNAIANGGINLTVDGTPKVLSAINLVGVTNLNAVAAALQTALAGAATVFWDSNNNRFVVKSATNGTGSSVALATSGSGTDLSVLLGLSAAVNGLFSVGGIASETPLAAVQTLAGMSNAWYGLMFAASVMPSDSDYLAVSAFIQAASPARIFGITTSEAGALIASVTTDIANQVKAKRTFVQYSSSNPYACAAAFGIAFTVNFSGFNTLYTLMFKQESGITPETLTETQSAALLAVFGNVFVNYDNGVAILQNGTMSDGSFFDVIHGTDWFQNACQTAVFNELLTNRKIAQTDAGVNLLVTRLSTICDQAVANGLIAPGVWNGPSIGAIVTGQTLSKGYYIFAPPVSSQSQAARAARQSPGHHDLHQARRRHPQRQHPRQRQLVTRLLPIPRKGPHTRAFAFARLTTSEIHDVRYLFLQRCGGVHRWPHWFGALWLWQRGGRRRHRHRDDRRQEHHDGGGRRRSHALAACRQIGHGHGAPGPGLAHQRGAPGHVCPAATSAALHGQNAITVAHAVSGDITTCTRCAFKKKPDIKYSKDGDILVWTWDAGKIDTILGTYQ